MNENEEGEDKEVALHGARIHEELMVSMIGDPYRIPAFPGEDLEPDNGTDYDWEVGKITVVFKFQDEEITDTFYGSVSYPHEPKDGMIKYPYAPMYLLADNVLNSFLGLSHSNGYFQFKDCGKPWSLFIRYDIVKREEKRIAFRWIQTED